MSNGANSAKPAVDMMAGMERQERILVIDFGSQVSHLICRRVREAGVYCELRSCLLKLEDVKNFSPNGIILSGGPHSVYDKDAPHLCKDIWGYIDEKKLPVFGICYGLQEMCHSLGGKVEAGVKREFGHADLLIREDVAVQSQNGAKKSKGRSPIFEGIDGHKVPVWMSHGDKVTQIPPGFASIAYTSNTEYAAIEDQVRHFYGVQYHPEVTHTPNGATMIKNFVLKVVGCKGEWNMHDFCQKQIDIIMNKLDGKYVVGAVSGGVDSSVAAALVHKAIGDRFRPFMVDTGLLRKDESAIVKERLEGHIPGMKLKVLDATADFYKELAGVTEPEKKRKIIGRLFVEAFEKAVSEMGLPHENCLLLQGTLYPDVIESTSYKGPSSIIKTHHNVGGLPDRMKMEVIEPLRLLFKDEVRALGRELGLPVTSVMRHPFPGPGLGIRIIGEINKETADRLSHADDIYIEELRKTGHYDKIGQAFAVLLPTVRSVGVMGDHRTYENVCVLRAVTTTDFMTADWYDMPHDVLARISNRIINEVKGINRVCYDVSSKPPATIEWE
ncbi:guaA [Symbiodinium microadriaticum]|nr:guaA [Symbiodinium microadriaticum]